MLPEEEEIQRWLRKAQHDQSTAERILATDGPEWDVAAFHCQQAVEKLLKAFLVAHRQPFEKIHDLGRLLDYCVEIDRDLESVRDSVEPMTIYAVAFRYPGPADPERSHVEQGLQVVRNVLVILKSRLSPRLFDK